MSKKTKKSVADDNTKEQTVDVAPVKKRKANPLTRNSTNSEVAVKKKKQKKKKAKKPQETANRDDEKSAKARNLSIEYLRLWKRDRGSWNFQKVRQVWLLKNMYNEEKLTEEDFGIMLEYLEGLSGIARKTTVDKAEKIMKDSDLSEKNSEEEKTTAPFSEAQLERVRQVLQLLY